MSLEPNMLNSIENRSETQGGEMGLTIVEILRSLSRHVPFILSCMIFSACCVAIFIGLHKPLYLASATLRIDPYRAGSLGVGDPSGSVAPDQSEIIHTEVAVMKSDSVALRTLNSLSDEEFTRTVGKKRLETNLPASVALLTAQQSNLLQSFESSTDIKLVEGTQLISVGVRALDPQLAALLANHQVVAYQQQSMISRDESVKDLRETLTNQIKNLRLQIASSQQKLASFQEANSILSTPNASNTVTDSLRALSERLAVANADRIAKEGQLRSAESSSPTTLASLFPNPELGELQTQQGVLFLKYAQLSAKFGPAYPPLQETKKQLDLLNTQVAVTANSVRERVRNDFNAADSVEKLLRQENEEQTAAAYRVNRNQAEFAVQLADVTTNSDLLSALQRKLQQATTDAEVSGINVIPVDRARPVSQPVGPSKTALLVSSILIGFFAGCVAAFTFEALSDNVDGWRRTEQAVGLPVLATLSLVAPKGKIVIVTQDAPEAEAYRTLRNRILLSGGLGGRQALLVTSTLPEGGSATCAANLAASFANSGRKTLLIDADLEHPQLQQLLLEQNAKGFGDLLTGDDANYQTLPGGHGHLSFLPAGLKNLRGGDELASVKFGDLLRYWRAEFECIIFHGAPIAKASSALILAGYAERVMLVEREGTSKIKVLRSAKQQLQQAGATMNGIVLSTKN